MKPKNRGAENWIKKESKKLKIDEAKNALQKCKDFESKHVFVWVKSETSPRCLIRKMIK